MDNQDLVKQLLAEIGDVFSVEDITTDFPQAGAIRFRGRLLVSEKDAYALLGERLAPHDRMPVIRQEDEQHVLLVLPIQTQIETVKPGLPWTNIALFLATVFSVLLAGIQQDTGNLLVDIWSGWPFAVGLLGILLTHEFGHYFAARYHGVASSLPYFIPMPFNILGTFGAVINIKAPMKNRRALLDIGAAGPLAGLVVAFPVLLMGLALSTVEPLAGQCSAEAPCLMEGNSILYIALKYLVFGKVLPSGGLDVMIHPLAFAGWAGILVTALNLLPVGTLDGGHVAYALLGEKARLLYLPILISLVALGFLWSGWWLWAAMLLFFGRMHAQPLDDTTPLDSKRKLIAVLALFVFIITFTPLPLTLIP